MVSKHLRRESPLFLTIHCSLKCPVSAHWGCLAKTQRDEILKAARERDKVKSTRIGSDDEEPTTTNGNTNRTTLEMEQTTEFVCGSCLKGGVCMSCQEVVLESGIPTKVAPEQQRPVDEVPSSEDAVQTLLLDDTSARPSLLLGAQLSVEPSDELLFRCITCKRLAHYEHLPVPSGMDTPSEESVAVELAEHYQNTERWRCADCVSYVYSVEHIIAWRPYPKNAVESTDEPANYKSALPREYLVKWADRSFRRVQWVPHMWLLATHPSRLKNFITGGTKLNLVDPRNATTQDGADAVMFEPGQEPSRDSSVGPDSRVFSPLVPNPDAEQWIPPAWKTVDRVLDVLFWAKRSKKNKQKRIERQSERDAEREAVYEHGEMPSADLTETVEEYERRTKRDLDEDRIDHVAWVFFKWQDLGYEDGKISR